VALGGTAQLHAFAQDMRSAGAAAAPRVRLAVTKVAYDMAADAKAMVRSYPAIDTGLMLNSIGVTMSGNQYVTTAIIAPTPHYSAYVELGTSRMAPRPFMGPAWDRNIPKLQAALAQIAAGV
jgi:HK97 gp10 family phage protein